MKILGLIAAVLVVSGFFGVIVGKWIAGTSDGAEDFWE